MSWKSFKDKIKQACFKIGLFTTKCFFNLKRFFFWMLLFTRNEFVTITVALSSNKKKSIMWYANNLIIPVAIIYSPYLLTLLSAHFHKVNFAKSFYELSITGALSLLGINVIRTSSSLLSEKLNENKIPPEFLKNVTDDIESVRTKLRLWAIMLTFVGGIFYFVQAGTLLDAKETVIKWYVLSFFILCFFSIFIGRIITVIQSNFTDNDNLIAIWMKLLNYKGEEEYANLKSLVKKGGL